MASAPGWFAEQIAHFTLTLTPKMVDTARKGLGGDAIVEVFPTFIFAPSSRSNATFALVLDAQIGAATAVNTSTALVVFPSITMQGGSTFAGPVFNLSFSPSIGIAGTEKYTRSLGLSVTPSLGFATGTSGFPYNFPFPLH